VTADAARKGTGVSGGVGRAPNALKPPREKRVGISIGGSYVAG
jgi:hypothetical protein